MKIEWLPKALEQLQQTIRHCKSEFGMKTANKFVAELKRNNALLIHNPQMGAIEQTLSHSQIEYRYLVIHPFKEIYHIEKETIYIDLLWHTSRSPQTLQEYFSNYPTGVCEEAPPYGKNSLI